MSNDVETYRLLKQLEQEGWKFQTSGTNSIRAWIPEKYWGANLSELSTVYTESARELYWYAMGLKDMQLNYEMKHWKGVTK